MLITSRYDTTTGEFIPVESRIGLLDRKLRVINENVDQSGEWLKAAQAAYKSIYGYEWQGDSLLLAREAMLYTFLENYYLKFSRMPQEKSIRYIAYIVSWNIWQMDGLKGVVPGMTLSDVSVFFRMFPDASYSVIVLRVAAQPVRTNSATADRNRVKSFVFIMFFLSGALRLLNYFKIAATIPAIAISAVITHCQSSFLSFFLLCSFSMRFSYSL